MERVLQRDSSALEAFYHELFKMDFLIVDRAQRAPLSDQPEYPSEFFGALAVKDKERNVVPVFTRADLIEEWAGAPLNFKSISSKALFELVPKGWWACLNPGTEVEKDFSPWELEQLRLGESSIKEIVEELARANDEVDFNLEPLKQDSYASLFRVMREFGCRYDSCLKIYAAREFSSDHDDHQTSRILVGLIHSETGETTSALIRNLKETLSRELIGDEFVRVVAQGPGENDAVISALRLTPPVYERASRAGIWHRIVGMFTK